MIQFIRGCFTAIRMVAVGIYIVTAMVAISVYIAIAGAVIKLYELGAKPKEE